MCTIISSMVVVPPLFPPSISPGKPRNQPICIPSSLHNRRPRRTVYVELCNELWLGFEPKSARRSPTSNLPPDLRRSLAQKLKKFALINYSTTRYFDISSRSWKKGSHNSSWLLPVAPPMSRLLFYSVAGLAVISRTNSIFMYGPCFAEKKERLLYIHTKYQS